MTDYTNDAAAGVMQRLTALLPERLRRGRAVVPVVRLSGVIGAVTPLRPGMSLAGVARCWSARSRPGMPGRSRW